ncbi:sigma-70 family RNA polymerase sigma factor [Mesonia sp. HuA40]|uniref:sigma-70 family RNA polymerase sigma factor n=1 Tax=Mesonia sp. HuA40 TaxID=2602761 RepID=UPI00210286D7|nr:sigma-70 family RNA polymerase sigma factor [Mesonia sp. HuA40]
MYAQSLFGVIENIIKNKAQSEDVLQEVMVKIWRNLPQYDPEKGRFFTWIVNIARNSAIDKYRSKAYKKERQNLASPIIPGTSTLPKA